LYIASALSMQGQCYLEMKMVVLVQYYSIVVAQNMMVAAHIANLSKMK